MYVMSDDAAGPTPAKAGPPVRRTALVVAALASAGAGLVHAAAAGSHNTDRIASVVFALVAAAQLGWAAIVIARPPEQQGADRRAWLLAVAGIVLNGAALIAWAVSRLVGLPLIGEAGDAEAVGVPDTLAAVLAAGATVAAAVALVRARDRAAAPRPARVPLAVAAALVTVLAVPGMVAPHDHGDDAHHDVATGDHHTDHGHAPAPAAAHEHHEGMDHAGAPGSGHHGAGRRIVSLDDPRLTTEQRGRAQELLDRTVRAMAKFTDEASVVAAGYESIGDASSGFEHFEHHGYRHDGIELDENRIEAIVFETKPGQPKKLSAAMYILEDGKTMQDVPEIAGSLTTWHLHEDLCWDPSGKRVVGLLRMGRCIPGGRLRVTSPMLHVWLDPQKCGPFAEVETENAIDRVLSRGSTTTRPPDADPCEHVHNGH
jgi:hypothetical protein